jgi:hypothetical protein
MKKSDHVDGSICLQGTQKVPKNYMPCCKTFEQHTKMCHFDLRYEYWQHRKIWVIKLSDEVGGGGSEITYCPYCGKKL